MANKHQGEVAIEIGGKLHTLSFDWNALAEVQATAGELALQEIFTMKITLLSKLLQIGLKRHHPDITEKQIMDASPTIYAVQKALSDALELTYWGPEGPPKEEKPVGDDDKKKPMTPSEMPSA